MLVLSKIIQNSIDKYSKRDYYNITDAQFEQGGEQMLNSIEAERARKGYTKESAAGNAGGFGRLELKKGKNNEKNIF